MAAPGRVARSVLIHRAAGMGNAMDEQQPSTAVMNRRNTAATVP